MAEQEKKVMNELFDKVFPSCRSIMGEGFRDSLDIMSEYMPLERLSFYTGQKVLNWVVPEEWVIKEAWIKDSRGKKIIDFKDNNLHLINYSDKIDQVLDLEQLKEHLYSLSWQEEAIPYVTSYYKKRWGFCMKYSQYKELIPGKYHVYIDSEFIDGELQIGHTLLKGNSPREVVLTAYLCHPSMANNELSGPIILAMLYRRIANWKNRNLTYRFIINPETIGTIAYLSEYGHYFKENMHSGMVLNCMGGNDTLHYKTSRQGTSPLDSIIRYLNETQDIICPIADFSPTSGSDERQYCSPGFNLPYGQMSKVMYYNEYHTSLDTKEFMGMDNLYKSLKETEKVLIALDNDGYYINKYPYGEIKLDSYNLYPDINSHVSYIQFKEGIIDRRELLNSVLMLLNYSDGKHKLSTIASKIGCSIFKVIPVVELLKEKELLEGPFFEKMSL